ncbi:MAG: hypothetical protein KDA85_14715, partial [Planctomycetaceae bacterium]|nr:hypothetical protein [Planctomycetaceae bacterium]
MDGCPMAEKLRVLFRCVVTAVAIARLGTGVVPRQAAASDLFEIQVVDQQTHRGIPMVEVKTVDDVALMTDSAGRVALDVTGLDNQQVYFAISSPGYELKPDGFGFHGVRLNVRRGGTATVELQRILPAERLYRVTGRNIYGDSVRLEKPVPLASPLIAGGVVGQDSVQVVPYHDQLYWFWGDTNRIGYPLGLFRTAGATSGLPGRGGLAADVGVDLTYFTNQTGFARAMVDVPDAEGVVWIDGVCTVKDDQGRERLVTHYSRRKGLADQLEHGLAVFNDDRQTFEVLQVLPLEEEWRLIRSHPIHVTDEGVDYLMFGDPFLTTRVPATLSAIQDPQQYQSFVCTTGGDPKQATPSRNTAGMLDWHWARLPPVTQKDEQRWLRQGLVQQEELRFLPNSTADPSHRVLM